MKDYPAMAYAHFCLAGRQEEADNYVKECLKLEDSEEIDKYSLFVHGGLILWL